MIKRGEKGEYIEVQNAVKRPQKGSLKLLDSILEKESRVWLHLDEIHDNDYGEGGNDEENYLSFSILTEEMLAYDREMRSQPGYRPYFMSFSVARNQNSESFAGHYSEELHYGSDPRRRWFTAVISQYGMATEENALYSFEGQIVFSASPVQFFKCNLKIIDPSIPANVLEEIDNTYSLTPKDDTEIYKLFDDVIGNVILKVARVYKVGHGNLLRLIGRDNATKRKFAMCYDVGFQKGSHAGTGNKRYSHYNVATYTVGLSKTDMVVLSHWDDDHIMGVVGAKDALFSVPWVAPDVEGGSVNALRLACFLEKKGSMNLVKKSDSPRPIYTSSAIPNAKILVTMGANKSKGGITPENCSGLVIANYRDGKNSIFCGDVPYKALDKKIWDEEYKNLVVPHHACKMDAGVVKAVVDGKAVYCRNEDGDTNHVEALEAKGYVVEKTEDAPGNYIELML